MVTWQLKRDAERKRLALAALRANPLRREPWMTPLERCDWLPRFRVAGASGCLACWPVREALRFRATCKTCLHVLELDNDWRALLLLVKRGTFPLHGDKQTSGQDPVKAWASAHEKLMHFCLQDPSFEIRLELRGIDDELVDVYSNHGALRFKSGDTCVGGSVAHLQLGFWGQSRVAAHEWWDKGDWSGAPPDFLAQFDQNATSVHAVVRYRGKVYTIEEAFTGDGEDHRGITCELINATSLMRWQLMLNEFIVHLELYIPTAMFGHFLGIGGCHRFYPAAQLGTWSLPAVGAEASLPASTLSLVGVLWSSSDGPNGGGRRQKFNYPFYGEFLSPPLRCSAADLQSDVPLAERARAGLFKIVSMLAEGGAYSNHAVRELRACNEELVHLTTHVSALAQAGMPVPQGLDSRIVHILQAPLRMAGHEYQSLSGMPVPEALAQVGKIARLQPVRIEARITGPGEGDWKWLEEQSYVDRLSLWALDALGRTRFQLHGLEISDTASCSIDERTSGGAHQAWRASGMKGNLHACFVPGRLRLIFLDRPSAELVLGETWGKIS